MKNCSKCKESKILDNFTNDKKYSDGKYPSCKECKEKVRRIYYLNNKEHIIRVSVKRKRLKYCTDISFKLKHQLRARLRTAIKRNYKAGSAIRDLGCSIEELKTYLESKFLTGMDWDNHTISGWHIDHIIPLSSFDLSDPNQLKKACHYTNLQPLWAQDNLSKGSSLV